MKHLKLFEKLYEKESKRYHTFAVFEEDNSTLPDFYMFDNDEDAFNFLANRVYKIYKENELDLNDLNDCKDATDLIEMYEGQVDEGSISYHLIYYSSISISHSIKLDNWIELERAAKKYNL
jgi:hypothetical protein